MFVGEFVGAGIVRGGSGRVAVLQGPSGKALARSLARRWRGARKFLAAMRLRHAEASTAAAIMRARALVKLWGSTQSSNACKLRANLGRLGVSAQAKPWGSTWGEHAGETLREHAELKCVQTPGKLGVDLG